MLCLLTSPCCSMSRGDHPPSLQPVTEVGLLMAMQEKIAINKEVVAAVSNFALISADGKGGMLKMWIDGLKRAKVTNFMVICIDDQVAETMKKLGVPYWRKDPVRTADKANSNHGISALKFQLVKVCCSSQEAPAPLQTKQAYHCYLVHPLPSLHPSQQLDHVAACMKHHRAGRAPPHQPCDASQLHPPQLILSMQQHAPLQQLTAQCCPLAGVPDPWLQPAAI